MQKRPNNIQDRDKQLLECCKDCLSKCLVLAHLCLIPQAKETFLCGYAIMYNMLKKLAKPKVPAMIPFVMLCTKDLYDLNTCGDELKKMSLQLIFVKILLKMRLKAYILKKLF